MYLEIVSNAEANKSQLSFSQGDPATVVLSKSFALETTITVTTMDVDNIETNTTSNNSNMDIEQSLLQQFSCMGTTDRDELVQQLQKLLGHQLNYSTAAFFLDMNNWNLQAAIGSYFDVKAPNKLPSMALASDPQASECANIEPNVSFKKTWHIYNNGTEEWPQGCYLQCAGGDNLGADRVYVSSLHPGEGAHLCVTLKSPSQPGMYQSKWRLCTSSGSYFGDTMWVILAVVEEGTMALTQQLSHFSDLGSVPPPSPVTMNPFNQQQQRSHSTSDVQEGPPLDDTDSNMC